jgi:GxxExxY protein
VPAPKSGANKDMKKIMELCDVVRQTAYDIHTYHSNGHLEKVYENALVNRLRKLGLDVKQQHSLTVYDEDGTILGEYFADLMIENQLVVELKACKALTNEHVSQVLGYLKASKIEHGLLINFGSYKFQIKKFILNGEFGAGFGPRIASLLLPFSALFAFFRG